MEASASVVSACASLSNAEELEEDEFAFVYGNPASPIPADQMFHNGQIKPMYQFLAPGEEDTFLLIEPNNSAHGHEGGNKSNPRPRLKALMLRQQEEEEEEEADESSSCCMWNPSISRDDGCLKSKPTVSFSRRWKLKELLPQLKRSNTQLGTTGVLALLGPDEKLAGGTKPTKLHEGGQQVVEYKQRRNVIQQRSRSKSFLPYKQHLLLAFFSLPIHSSSSSF